jgi:hypothetical protein
MEREPHHDLNNPASDPDPTEWPDPYEERPDPRGPEDEEDAVDEADGERKAPRAPSTSEPHPPGTYERAKREGEGKG